MSCKKQPHRSMELCHAKGVDDCKYKMMSYINESLLGIKHHTDCDMEVQLHSLHYIVSK